MIHKYYSLIIWIYLILSNIFDMIPFWFWHPQSDRGAIGISFPFPARLECTNLSYMMRVAITMPGRGQEMLVRTNPKWFQEFETQVLMRSPTTLINSHKIRVSSRHLLAGSKPLDQGAMFFSLDVGYDRGLAAIGLVIHGPQGNWNDVVRCFDVPWCVWMQPWWLHDSIPCCTQIPVSPIAVPKGKKIEAATVHPLESSMA